MAQQYSTPHWANLNLDPEAVLEELWRSSLVALTLVTEEGRWLHPSPALCELLEYTASELEGMTFADVTDPRDMRSDVKMAEAVRRGDIPYYVMSKRYITKTGKVVWIKLHVSGFFDDSGHFLFYLSQIAPAEIFDPKAPVVIQERALESRILDFVKRNWRWLAPALTFTAGALYKGWEAYMRILAYLENNP